MRSNKYDVDIMSLSKAARLTEFFHRLQNAPPCGSADEAMLQLCELLTAVEDEFSGVPNQPDNHIADGRMYPPQADAARPVEARPELTRYRSRAHNTYVSEDGGILVTTTTNQVLFSKPGSSGAEINL